jgi:hypothetical protein
MKLLVELYQTNENVFFKNGEAESKTVPVWGLVPVGGEGHKERVYGEVNMVEILCTHV